VITREGGRRKRSGPGPGNIYVYLEQGKDWGNRKDHRATLGNLKPVSKRTSEGCHLVKGQVNRKRNPGGKRYRREGKEGWASVTDRALYETRNAHGDPGEV